MLGMDKGQGNLERCLSVLTLIICDRDRVLQNIVKDTILKVWSGPYGALGMAVAGVGFTHQLRFVGDFNSPWLTLETVNGDGKEDAVLLDVSGGCGKLNPGGRAFKARCVNHVTETCEDDQGSEDEGDQCFSCNHCGFNQGDQLNQILSVSQCIWQWNKATGSKQKLQLNLIVGML